jgi:ubiquinol-cytochrome c reductase cytochrome c1 subunit
MRTVPALCALLIGAALVAGDAHAVGETPVPPAENWSFNGIFGTFDQAATQRGFQVFQTVCQGCHSSKYLAFRTLQDIGYSEEDVKAIAAGYTVTDGPNEAGEMFERPGRPSDFRPGPYDNPQAARAANGGALPPDLSLIAKARAHGPDYVYHLLVGYEEPAGDVNVPEGMYYNHYFPGHMIAMPPPLQEGVVEYQDGTPATVAQMAADVTQFLMWLAEPKLEERKQMGIKVMLFLVVLTGLLYAYKRKVWADVAH